MLVTDWRAPSSSTLARISDPRAMQFWDPHHLVSQELTRIVKSRPPQPQPNCCQDNGFFWDDAILYAPHTGWNDMPISIFWNGPVWKIIPALEQSLQNKP